MRGSHQCSFKLLLLPTVLMTINIKLLHTYFKWHASCLVMQILFFVCHLSIKARPFLPSSAHPPFFSTLLAGHFECLSSLSILPESGVLASKVPPWGHAVFQPHLHLSGSVSSLMHLNWVSSVSYCCHLISETRTVWAHFGIKPSAHDPPLIVFSQEAHLDFLLSQLASCGAETSKQLADSVLTSVGR